MITLLVRASRAIFTRETTVSPVRCDVDDPTNEVTDLLQQLIRNACVNDGSVESGHEARSADLLALDLEGPGSTSRRYEAATRSREPRRTASRAPTRPHRRCC